MSQPIPMVSAGSSQRGYPYLHPTGTYTPATTAGQTQISNADTLRPSLSIQRLSGFEFALFSHFIHEKIDSLFRNLEFGRNPRRL